MSEMEKKKKYPFEIDEYYSIGLNSLKRVYTQHPKFNGNVRLIYELLFDYWNEEFGYAFPDQWELARESGMSRRTVIRHIQVLEELDLVEVKKSPIGKGNNVYYLKKPLTTVEELYKKFPEIESKAKERIEKINREEEVLREKLNTINEKTVEFKYEINARSKDDNSIIDTLDEKLINWL